MFGGTSWFASSLGQKCAKNDLKRKIPKTEINSGWCRRSSCSVVVMTLRRCGYHGSPSALVYNLFTVPADDRQYSAAKQISSEEMSLAYFADRWIQYPHMFTTCGRRKNLWVSSIRRPSRVFFRRHFLRGTIVIFSWMTDDIGRVVPVWADLFQSTWPMLDAPQRDVCVQTSVSVPESVHMCTVSIYSTPAEHIHLHAWFRAQSSINLSLAHAAWHDDARMHLHLDHFPKCVWIGAWCSSHQ